MCNVLMCSSVNADGKLANLGSNSIELYRYSLIPLSRGSFDVIVGMDWLSKRKFVIVCHEKVVRIPLEGDEILRVHGERTQGVVKTLMNTKVDEPKLSDISVVRDFIDVFPIDLSMNLHKRTGKANVVTDALSRNERVEPRRVRAMAMAIQYGVPLVGSEHSDEALHQVIGTSGSEKKFYNIGDMYWWPMNREGFAIFVSKFRIV
ncbi:hypothetical protein Tco_1244645 [Tanacetum coccineum]